MTLTLIQMGLLMLAGALWAWHSPNQLSGEQTRHVLTSVVYYLFLPALVLDALWQAAIGWNSLQISLLGCSSIVVSLGISALVCKLFRLSKPQTGAALLASAYPNVTYLGLPVLEQALGPAARSVVIQMDLFAAAPLVYTLGMAVAQHYGAAAKPDKRRWRGAFLNTPPFWAAFIAIACNYGQVPEPAWLAGLLRICSAAVAPLMIFSLGLALSWRTLKPRTLPVLAPVMLIKLGLMPAFAWVLVGATASVMVLSPLEQHTAILDIAMPSMVLGIVLCDRYQLDSALYAAVVTVTTAASLITLPLWHGVL